jgi:hypothetical protein
MACFTERGIETVIVRPGDSDAALKQKPGSV